MNVERFTIPEILFRPSIIGIDQAGIAESIYNSVEQLPERKRKPKNSLIRSFTLELFRYSTEFIQQYSLDRWKLSISQLSTTFVSLIFSPFKTQRRLGFF